MSVSLVVATACPFEDRPVVGKASWMDENVFGRQLKASQLGAKLDVKHAQNQRSLLSRIGGLNAAERHYEALTRAELDQRHLLSSTLRKVVSISTKACGAPSAY